jgi:hypothetical protein
MPFRQARYTVVRSFMGRMGRFNCEVINDKLLTELDRAEAISFPSVPLRISYRRPAIHIAFEAGDAWARLLQQPHVTARSAESAHKTI